MAPETIGAVGWGFVVVFPVMAAHLTFAAPLLVRKSAHRCMIGRRRSIIELRW